MCGSGNAAVGTHIHAHGLLARVGSRYTAAQGDALGRTGRVEVEIDGTT